jgi:tyrosine-protein kinase Etk/Wzc
VQSYETELRGAEEQLRTFRERNQVVSLTDEASEQVKRLAELQAQRDALRSERDALAELLAQTNGGAATGSQTAAYRQLSSFPVFLSNQAVQNILQSLTELENERAKLLVQRTAENLDVQGVNQRIRELELQLYQIAVNYHRSLDSQVASVESALGRFGAQLEEIPAREVQFARLSREQTLLAEIYNLLHTRLKEAELKEAVEPGNVQTIDTALVPDRPISPRPLRNLAMALVGGLVLGMVGALTRETMDTKVRSKEDVHALSGGMPVLGTIPRIQMDAAPGSNGNGKRVRVPKIVSLSPDEFLRERLVTQHDPQSPAAEAYRALRTSITFAGVGRNTQALVVTSAMPGDGKSTSSSNLAIAFTQQGLRTLLIDADLRRGLLHKVFDMPQDPGLTHVLMGRAALDDAIRDTGVGPADTPLHFLPAGVFPPNPAELLGSERMRVLVADLRKRYDILVFDAPPLNLVTDASVLGTITDATLLVARAGVTDRRALHHAAAQLHQLGSSVSGIVLNDFDSGKAYGYTYGYATNGSSKNGRNGKH